MIQEIQQRRHLWVVTVIPATPWKDIQLIGKVWMEPVSAEITLERRVGRWEADSIEVRGKRKWLSPGEDTKWGSTGGIVVYDITTGFPQQFQAVIDWAICNAETNWRKS